MFFRKQKTKISTILISKSFWGALAFLLFFGWLVRADDIEKNILIKDDNNEVVEKSEKETIKEDENKNNRTLLTPSTSVSPQRDGSLEKEEVDKEDDDQNEKLEKPLNPSSSASLKREDFLEKIESEPSFAPISIKVTTGKESSEGEKNENQDKQEESGQQTKEEIQEEEGNKDDEVVFIELVINEIAWMGTTTSSYDEWIELKNLSEEKIDLKDWFLEIGDRKIELEGEIEKGGFYLLERTDDDSVPNIKADLIYTGGLSNGGEDLLLKDDQGNLIDEVKNSQSWTAGDNNNKFTMERLDDGKWQNSFLVNGTPKQENSTKNDEDNNDNEGNSQLQSHSEKLEITELMPNPEGADKNQEWVELFNGDKEKIYLEDWYLLNQSNKKFALDEFEINTDQFLKIEIKNSSFSIKNSQGWIELRNPNGEIVDKVEYLESAKMNASYNKKSSQIWEWSIFITPGEKNKFNQPPTFKVDIPEDIYKDVKSEFKIKNARDKDGEELKYRWKFSTGKRSYIPITTQTFDKKGNYTVEVRVSDSSIDVFKSFRFRVKSFPDFDLEIVKLLPNPEGSDSENEKIWIKNNEDQRINLKGWIIATGKDSESLTNHYIKDDFKIKAGDTRDLERDDCAFSLLNKKGRVVLKSPDGSIVDKVKYEKEKIEEEEIYLKKEDQWIWRTPFLIEKENPVQVLGSNKNSLQKESAIDFFGVFSKIFNENQKSSGRLKIVCFKNWLYSKSEKPFFDVIFNYYSKNII